MFNRNSTDSERENFLDSMKRRSFLCQVAASLPHSGSLCEGRAPGVSHWHYNDCLQGADQIEEGFRRASYNAKTVRKLIRNLFMDSTGPLAAAFSIYVRVLLRRYM